MEMRFNFPVEDIDLYFVVLPREINELILYHIDNIETTNILKKFSVFRQIYDDKNFVNRMIIYNMSYYKNICFSSYIEKDKLSNYYGILLPTYDKALSRYKLYTYEKDGKIIILKDDILSGMVGRLDHYRPGKIGESCYIDFDSLEKIYNNEKIIKNNLIKPLININKGIVRIQTTDNIYNTSSVIFEEKIELDKKQLITLMMDRYLVLIEKERIFEEAKKYFKIKRLPSLQGKK